MSSVVVLLVLDGWDVVQAAVEAGRVIPLDPFVDNDLDIVDAAPGPLLGQDVSVADELGRGGGVKCLLTRPLGASLRDLLTQEHSYGGVGLGASVTSLLFLGVIVALVAREQVKVSRHGGRVGPGPRVPGRSAGWATGPG